MYPAGRQKCLRLAHLAGTAVALRMTTTPEAGMLLITRPPLFGN